MPVLIDQKFPRCTLCGKMLPLRSEPVIIQAHRLCSKRCVRLLHKLHPDELSEGDMRKALSTTQAKS